MSEEKLTQEAKEAIRSYMLRLIALPGAIVALVAFLLGYFIQDVAQAKASFEIGNEMRKDLSDVLNGIQNDIRTFTERTAEEKVKAKQTLDDIANLQTEAQKIQLTLGTLKTFQDSQQFVTDVSNLLKSDSTFKESLKVGALKECRICFQEIEGSSQCQDSRSSCSGWSSSPDWTAPFRDDTDSRGGGCTYQWKLECK